MDDLAKLVEALGLQNVIHTAVVFVDPQSEILSDKGLARGALGDSVRENKTVENIERIF